MKVAVYYKKKRKIASFFFEIGTQRYRGTENIINSSFGSNFEPQSLRD